MGLRTPLRIALLAGLLALAPSSPAPACPACKEALAAQPEQAGRVAEGYSRSILLLMAMPFALLGTGAFLVVRAARRGVIPRL